MAEQIENMEEGQQVDQIEQTEQTTQDQKPQPPKAHKLYDNLISDGYTTANLGSKEEFTKALSDNAKANKFYDNLIKEGYTADNIGSKNEFVQSLSQKKNDGQTGSNGISPTESQSSSKETPKTPKPSWQTSSLNPLTGIQKNKEDKEAKQKLQPQPTPSAKVEEKPVDYNFAKNYESAQNIYSLADKKYKDAKQGKTGWALNYISPIFEDIEEAISPAYKQEKQQNINKAYTTLQNESKNAKNAQLALKAEIPKILSPINSNLNNYIDKSTDGAPIPNIYKLDEFAKNEAKKAGLPEDGYFKKLIYNEAKANVAQKIIEPTVNKKFNELYKKETGKDINEDLKSDYDKGFVKAQEIKQKTELTAKQIATDISLDTKNKVNELQASLIQQVNTLNSEVVAGTQAINEKYKGLIKDNKFIGNEQQYQEYQQDIASVQKKQKENELAYQKLNKDFINQQHLISTKANARYRRQIEEISRFAQNNIEKESLKYSQSYKQDPKIKERIERLYKQAYSQTLSENEKLKSFVSDVSNTPTVNFAKSIISSLGGTIKGISTSIGFDAGQTFGDYLENKFQVGSSEIKSLSDVIDPQKMAKSGGQLVGGMLPSMLGSAAAAAATGGESAIVQLVTTGLAGWAGETIDMAGRAESDKFESTGDAVAAKEASRKTVDSQVMLMPLYALEGLPFMEAPLNVSKNKIIRAAIGGAIEYGTELPQEYLQNLSEEAIKNDESYKDMFKYHSAEKLKNTALNIAPVFLLGSVGQITKQTEEEKSAYATEQAAKSFALKTKFADLAPSQREQFLFDVMQRQGVDFTSTYLLASYTAGHIDKATFEELGKTLVKSADILNKAEKLGLNPAQTKILNAFSVSYDKAKEAFNEEKDPLLKSIASAKLVDYETQINSLVTKQEPNYAVVSYPNNEQYLFTHTELENALNNQDFANAISNGEINITLNGDKEKLNKKIEDTKASIIAAKEEQKNVLKEKEKEIKKEIESKFNVQIQDNVGELGVEVQGLGTEEETEQAKQALRDANIKIRGEEIKFTEEELSNIGAKPTEAETAQPSIKKPITFDEFQNEDTKQDLNKLKTALEPEAKVETSQTGTAEKKPDIILAGLNMGYVGEGFDVRVGEGVNDELRYENSFAKVIEKGGKKYVVVGLRLDTARPANTVGRDNYSFATAEFNETTPKNIVDILENAAKENFKNVYPDFNNKDVVKPITSLDVELKERQQAELPKQKNVGEKAVTTPTKVEEVETEVKPVEVKEGDVVELPSQVKGGVPRTMVFNEGEWKQRVGGNITNVGENVKQQAQDAFTKKAEVVTTEAKVAEPKKAELPEQPKTKTQQIGEGLLSHLGIPLETKKPTGKKAVNINNKSELSELESKTQGEKKTIIQAAKNAIATLKSVFPDMEIYIHEDADSYNETMREEVGGVENSRGNFAFERDSNNNPTGKGRIDINLSNAKDTTVAHELTHAVLLKAFGDNPAIFKTFRDRMSSILKEDLNKEVTAFESLYSGQEVAPEEYLTELSALLSKGGETVEYKPSTLRKIAALINEIVSKITNGKLQPFKSEADFKNFVDFLNEISAAIKEGDVIKKLNTQESYSSGESISISNPKDFVGKKIGEFKSKAEIGDYQFPDNIEILKIADLPIKNLTDLVRKYEGKVVIITSDATGYGIDKMGQPIFGGFGFSANAKNVNDGIGFASVSIGTVKGTYTAAEKAYGLGKSLVLVMVQPPHTTINNSYGAKYMIRGIKEIAGQSKEELVKTKEAIKDFIKNSTAIQNELKGNEASLKRGSEKRLFELIDSIDENTDLDAAVEEFLADTTFTIRKELGKGIILENKDIRTNKSTNYAKIALNNAGYNIYSFLKEYGDNTILNDEIILNNTGGYVVGGFELDILPTEQREKLISDIQSKGIVHPLFNAKLPGTNHFRLDGLYDVQENFSEYVRPETTITLEQKERDKLVRKYYKEDKYYNAQYRSIPLNKRTYTQLTIPAKTEFKEKYLRKKGALVETVPNIATKVAKGEGFITKPGAAEKMAQATYVSKAQKPQIKDYIDSQRKAGESEEDIRAGIESVADKIGLTKEDIDSLMSGEVKAEVKKETVVTTPPPPPTTPKVSFGEGEEGKNNKKDFDKLTSTIPNSGDMTKYLSGETIEKYEGEVPRNEQDVYAQQLMPALQRGIDIIEKAKELFGDKYIEKTLDYVETENLSPANKALIYISLENELAKQKIENPDNIAKIEKMQDLVRTKSQAFLRSNSLAINFGRLRSFAKAGYDISRLTDRFFSSKQMEEKSKIEKAVEATADDINKEAEAQINEQALTDEEIRSKIEKGVEEEVAKLYEKLPKEKKRFAVKAISALDKIQKSLRNKSYSDVTGITAFIDAGITTIKAAIKAGIKVADAIEMGIDKIKKMYEDKNGKAWEKENEFRKDITEALKAEGVIDKKAKSKEKTQEERLADAKERISKKIEEVQSEIINKKRVEKKGKQKLKADEELNRLKERLSKLEALRDKYLPKEKNPFTEEKNLESAKNKLTKDILELNRQIEKGQKDKLQNKESKENKELDALRDEKESRQAILEALDPTPRLFIENALIEQGYGRQVNVKTKSGVEKRFVLDWKKLAGEEGSVDNIRERVESSLKDKGYTEEQILRMQDGFVEEYNNLRQSIIEKAQTEIAARNKVSVTPEQKSAAKKLAEMYNYGLFDKDIVEYETALSRTIGVDTLSQENLKSVIELGKAMSDLFNSSFQGKSLTESQIRSAIQVIEEHMRYVLQDEASKHGGNFLKVADITRTYMDTAQRMTLNTFKQAIENPLSGRLESLYSSIGYGGKISEELTNQQRDLARSIYKEMVLQKGIGYGNVSSAFVNKGNIDMYINKMPDNELMHAITSTAIGKTTLDAVDSFYKSKITQQKFTHNLIKILTEDRIVNNKIEKGMSVEDAKKYVAEKLTGQSFKEAQETAKNIIDKVNNNAGEKILNDSQLFVDRLANDIVNAALINGEKVTEEMVNAAYNAAYKAAGRGLGHVANNFISRGINAVSGRVESEINQAIKEKEYNKAAVLTFASIFFRNIANPFVGGGTNWVVLKLEKSGLGLLSGLGSMMSGGRKLDLTTESGIAKIEDAMYQSMKVKDKFIRGAVGGLFTALTALIFAGIKSTDEYEKWKKRNKWADKYLNIITPEIVLAMLAQKGGEMKKYLENAFNKNESFDKGKMSLDAIRYLSSGEKEKGMGKVGQLMGSSIGSPIPWRLVRDGQQVWEGVTGKEVYAVNNNPSLGLMEGFLKGGMIDYIGLAPSSEDNSRILTKDELEKPEYKIYKEKEIKIPENRSRKTYKVDTESGEMTSEQYDKFISLVNNYMENGFTKEEGNTEKEISGLKQLPQQTFKIKQKGESTEEVLGSELSKEDLQNKVNQLHQNAVEQAKYDLKLTTKKPRRTVTEK